MIIKHSLVLAEFGRSAGTGSVVCLTATCALSVASELTGFRGGPTAVEIGVCSPRSEENQ